MSRSIKGFLILAGLIAVLSGFAWWQYYGPRDPDHVPSLPEQAHDIRENTEKPIQQFEQELHQRVDDAKGSGVDLTQPPKR